MRLALRPLKSAIGITFALFVVWLTWLVWPGASGRVVVPTRSAHGIARFEESTGLASGLESGLRISPSSAP